MNEARAISQLVHRVRRRLWVLRDSVRRRILGKTHHASVFKRIYDENLWGDPESLSGGGSSLAATENVRRELPSLMTRFECRTLLDAPCGDFVWMKTIVGTMDRYVGLDIVPDLVARNQAQYGSERVSFACADLSGDTLPHADLALCRDCFIHLPTSVIRAAIRNFARSGARYLLTTNDRSASAYHDIAVGGFRVIDFMRPPFNFPPPLAVICESGTRELALWELSTIAS
jgi:hypothetical protein